MNKETSLSEKDFIVAQKLFTELFETITGIAAIVDQNRHIVYANNDFLDLFCIDNIELILGKSHGEALACINVNKGPAGCGSYKTCGYCGAINAILESQTNNAKSSKEARITSTANGKPVSMDFKITASPVKFKDRTLYAVMMQDISNEKRLQFIERVFFHDLLNVAGGLNGLLTILKMGATPEEIDDLIDRSEEASQIILEEILAYRQMQAAESGNIKLNIETVNSIDIIKVAIRRIEYHFVGKDKKIELTADSTNVDFKTDRLLLQRVFINLLKNALEASEQNGIVTVAVKEKNDKLIFSVKNSGVMPENVQMQIFQRSFSTKDSSRGVGTYSVKLFTENYLQGKVSFVSNEKEDTVFSVELNRQWQTS